MATHTEVNKVLMLLAAQYPYWEREMTEERIKIVFALYARFLGDLSAEVLEAAALAHITESRFFPTVAELRAQALEITEPDQNTALEAWYDNDDPIARRVRNMLPDYNGRMITTKEQSIIRAQFIKNYNEISARERKERRRLPEIQALRERLLEGEEQGRLEDHRKSA